MYVHRRMCYFIIYSKNTIHRSALVFVVNQVSYLQDISDDCTSFLQCIVLNAKNILRPQKLISCVCVCVCMCARAHARLPVQTVQILNIYANGGWFVLQIELKLMNFLSAYKKKTLQCLLITLEKIPPQRQKTTVYVIKLPHVGSKRQRVTQRKGGSEKL